MARAAKLPAAIDARHPSNVFPAQAQGLKVGQKALIFRSQLVRDIRGRLFIARDARINSTVAEDQTTVRLYNSLFMIERVKGGFVLHTTSDLVAPQGRDSVRWFFSLGRAYIPVVQVERIEGT